MATLLSINSKLASLSVVSGFDQLAAEASNVASNVQALNSSSLGGLFNETISGVQAINTTTIPEHTVGVLTENLTGLRAQIVKDVSAAKTALDKITGASVDNSFNDLVYASATGEGVKAAINYVTDPTDQQLTTILENTVPTQFVNQISNIVKKDFTGFSGDLSTAVGSFNRAFNDLLGITSTSPLQAVLLQNDAGPLNIIENLGVNKLIATDVLVLLQSKQISAAIDIITKLTGKISTDVESILGTVPLTLQDQIQKRNVGTSSTGVYEVSDKNNEWNGESTPTTFFDVIATQEHLTVEMLRCPREVTEVVFYGHEMTENQVLTASEIHEAYIADGNDGIPFHYVILPNGNIQRGRPISRNGTYSTTHSDFSIGVVVPHVKDAPATVKQGQSARQLIEAFYSVWPGGQVFDAQIDTGDSDVKVGFNVANFIASLKKVNYGSAARSFSTRQLISAAQGNV